MTDFFASIADFFQSTQIPEQIQNVDVSGLLTNTWFMVPFLGYVGYLVFKKALNSLVLIAVIFAIWMFSGSNMVKDVFHGDEMQVGKLLPIIGFGVAMIGVVVYVLFIRSD